MKNLYLVIMTRKHEKQEYIHCIADNLNLALLMGEHHVISRAKKYSFSIVPLVVETLESTYSISSYNTFGAWSYGISKNNKGETFSVLSNNDFSLSFLQDLHTNLDYFSNEAKESLRNITEYYLRNNH